MSLIVPNTLITSLENLFDTPYLDSAILHLYKNNHTPAVGDNIAAYTESTFTGYASQGLGAVAPAAVLVANIATKTWPQKTFTCTGGAGESMYGYYVTDGTNTQLLWAELYPAGPLNMVNGVAFLVTPFLGLSRY